MSIYKPMFPTFDEDVLDQWCELGVAYGKGLVKVRGEDIKSMADNRDLQWAFDLGYRASQWKDKVQ